MTIVFAELSRETLLDPRDVFPLTEVGTPPVAGGVGEGNEDDMSVTFCPCDWRSK